MAEEDVNPNPMCLAPEALEEIFLRLPLKSILRFKTVSKQWRSILESREFAERRRMMNVQTKPKIMAAGARNRSWGRFQGDEEAEMVYLHCDVASRPSLSCDGLVCIPLPGWVNVLNPSTGEFLRFPSGPDPVKPDHAHAHALFDSLDVFPGYWTMGFGRDSINGSYKIVRLCFNPDHYSEILDVNIGKWRKLSPPPYEMGYRKNSACVNGSIYWLQVVRVYKILALDLHTEEWRDVRTPPVGVNTTCQVANLENLLAVGATYGGHNHWNLSVWGLDAREETWSVIYSFLFFSPDDYFCHLLLNWFWFRPVAISKQGNLFFHDNQERLFKYYPGTNQVRCIAANIRVISPFVEDLVPLRRLVSGTKIRTYGFQCIDHVPSRRISDFFGRRDIAEIMLTTAAIVTLGMFCLQSVWSRS